MQQTTNVNDSVHNCFFCYERRRASLEEEISFFELRLGSNRTLIQLLALRREYRNLARASCSMVGNPEAIQFDVQVAFP